jgi:UDP-glucose 4-epimerase
VVDSVLHPAVVNELVNKADVVYHLAAAVGVKTIVEQPVRTLRVNLGGTETVLDACCTFNKPVLLASTSEVYGDHRTERPLAETSRRIYGATTQKRWAYADSKAMDEFLALAYHEEFGLDAVIVRLFNTVGPRQTGMYGMVVPRFVDSALANEAIEIYGDGEQTRCFCHVQDTIRALRDLMVDLNRTSGEIFNVGARNQTTILGLAETVKRMTGSDSPTVHVPFNEVYGTGIEDMLHRVPCIDKVRSTIGWEPTRNLEDILNDVIEQAPASVALAA